MALETHMLSSVGVVSPEQSLRGSYCTWYQTLQEPCFQGDTIHWSPPEAGAQVRTQEAKSSEDRVRAQGGSAWSRADFKDV